jgi:hypothetical protein
MTAKKQIVALLLCLAFSLSLAYQMRHSAPGRILMVDFGGVYFGARCALRDIDPYNPNAVLHEFESEGGRFLGNPTAAKESRFAVTWDVYLPSALFVVIPFAVLPWGVAQNLWIFLTAALLALAAFLMIDLGGRAASILSCCLLGFLLANCELLFKVGNVAGASVSLCAIGAWCFLKRRYELAGVLFFAISLLLKPHDSGFVWLFFLLSGGVLRKRALQSLAITALLGLCSALWIARPSPHWSGELHNNLAAVSVSGGTSDPGPTGITSRGIVPIISLQSAVSIFKNDPGFYNPFTYLVVGILILIWVIAVLRKTFSLQGACLALAAVSAFTLLLIYHRTYDAKLLLLTVPACALLWSIRYPQRWIALILTAAAIFFTSDIPIALSLKFTERFPQIPSTFSGKLVSMVVVHPASLVLLALGCFYLWAYLHYAPAQLEREETGDGSPAPAETGKIALSASQDRISSQLSRPLIPMWVRNFQILCAGGLLGDAISSGKRVSLR